MVDLQVGSTIVLSFSHLFASLLSYSYLPLFSLIELQDIGKVDFIFLEVKNQSKNLSQN